MRILFITLVFLLFHSDALPFRSPMKHSHSISFKISKSPQSPIPYPPSLSFSLKMSKSPSSSSSSMLKRLQSFAPLIGWYILANLPIYGIGLPFFGQMTDFKLLQNRNPPTVISNEYIVAPEDFTPRARIDQVAPVFRVPVDKLEEEVKVVMNKLPRITYIAEDKATTRVEYVQRTLLFRFPDVITIQTIPLDSNSATLAIHSSSVYGAGDLGVNKQRVQEILGDLSLRIQ